LISRGSKQIVEGNFQNLGNKHSRNRDEAAALMSLESKLEFLKKKYTSGAKDKSQSKTTQLSGANDPKRPVSPSPISVPQRAQAF
jgi:hypothetical protein